MKTVHTINPVTFGYSLSSNKTIEAVITRQLRRWKRLWHAQTRWLRWSLPEDVRRVKKVHCSRRRLLRRGLEFHVCTINKSAHTKKSGNLLWTPYISIYLSTLICMHQSISLSAWPSQFIHVYLSIYLSIYIYIYTYIYIYIYVCMYIYIPVDLFASVYQSVYLSMPVYSNLSS